MTETKSGVARLLSAAMLLGVVTIAGCGAEAGGDDIAVQTENLDLTAPNTLYPGESLWSSNHLYRLTMQSDCNLVMYVPNAIWKTDTWNKGTNCHAAMQLDGNFVVYSGTKALWASGTWGHPGAYIEMQDDRNLVIYNQYREALWASNTYVSTPPPSCSSYAPLCFNPPPGCVISYCLDGTTRPSASCGACTF